MPELGLESAFQRRMVEGDWRGSLPDELEQRAGQVDLVLWDLCDERLGVHELRDGHRITRSTDALRGQLLDHVPTARHLPFGSVEHLQEFTVRLRQFVTLLTDLGLSRRTVVLAPPWAQKALDTVKQPTSYGKSADELNPVFATYHEIIETQSPFRLMTTDPLSTLASAAHRWGLAPFHYADSVYSDLSAQVWAACAEQQDDPDRL